ncbi:MAG: response regulator [Nitrosomonadales bacterium]|nr:response regulator [Nitrosomonadales bacterium]
METTRYNVLLVEDDLPSIDLARRAVAESCPEVDLTVVGGGDAVLDWLNSSAARNEQMPHIILLDLKLPKLDGLAVLRTLRKHGAIMRDVPIVAFSAEYTQADVLMSYQVGANSFVNKPTDLAQFTGFLMEQLAYWLQSRQRRLNVASAQNAPE